jgi:3',5'-cyclic AMP phosphodiesterase CpdA
MPMRVLHFSDPHVVPRLRAVPLADWPGKRFVGAAGLHLLKRKYLRGVKEKLAALAELAVEQRVDLVLCTGDLTVLGTEHELADARRLLQPLFDRPLGLIAVPGNHDLYTPDTVRERRFERHFADAILGGDAKWAVDGPWPLVRRFGDDVAVVAVTSAEPFLAPWQSGGRIPQRQLAALKRVLADPSIRGRFVFVMTHHAPRLANGRPDRVFHGLKNQEEFLSACGGIDRGAVLFGHVHHRFRLQLPDLDAALYDAGSATMRGREGFWIFDVDGTKVRATPGHRSDGRYRLIPDEARDC